jgi:hypothetical protein
MYLSVIRVEPLAAYKLDLTFENNEHRVFDVSPYLSMGKYTELKDPVLFRSVRPSFDSIQWDNEMDFDPEFLYEKSVPAGS